MLHPVVHYYVSTRGNDSWSGCLPDPTPEGDDGPFASLERARDAVRALLAEPTSSEDGIDVCIRGGVYPRTSSLELTAPDSGTESCPVIWRAHAGEDVLLTGARPLTGFKPIDDPETLERLNESARGEVLATDLKEQGIAGWGDIEPRGGPGMEVFFRGKRMPMARWPKDQWQLIADVPQTGEKRLHEGLEREKRYNNVPIGRHYGRIKYQGDQPKRWSNIREILLHGYWTWDWNDSFQKVEAIDTATREITIREPHHSYGYTKRQRFHFLNVLEELTQPGEWCLDRERGILYFRPPGPIDEGDVTVSMLSDPFIVMDGAEHVTVRDLEFAYARDGAVVVKGGHDSLIAGCTFRCLGAMAVHIRGRANGITSCDIHDVSSGGIDLGGGDRKTLEPAGNFAVNNHIYDFSRWLRTYQYAIAVSGVGNRAAHNCIHNAPQEAVTFNGNDHVLELNEIYDVCRETEDSGAIHTGRDWTWQNNVVRHNYIHHLSDSDMNRGGVIGVYLDDFMSGTAIVGNVFYKACQAAFIGGGRNNRIENNVFVDCNPSAHVDARGLGWAAYYFDGTYNVLFERMDKMAYDKPPYSERYPYLPGLIDDEPATPKHNRIARNISVGGAFLELYDDLDLSVVEVRNNVIAGRVTGIETRDDQAPPEQLLKNGNVITEGDAGVGGADTGELVVADSSPAWALGFEPIPFDKIGLTEDEYRQTIDRVNVSLAFVRSVTSRHKPRAVFQLTFRNRGNGPAGGTVYVKTRPVFAAVLLTEEPLAFGLAPGEEASLELEIQPIALPFTIMILSDSPSARPCFMTYDGTE